MEITVLDDHVYFDEAQSGSIRARPGLEALKKAAEDKQFDALLVDDSSRLSRDNQHFNTLLCLFQFWGISLISVSDGLDMREEHAKVAYQFRGIIKRAVPHRPQEEDPPRTDGSGPSRFAVGCRGYSYTSVPDGETKYDKKGASARLASSSSSYPRKRASCSASTGTSSPGRRSRRSPRR